ncbi:MAG: lysylphosphatidylglycerol synthase transmembrane domain-containing protein [bacterium]
MSNPEGVPSEKRAATTASAIRNLVIGLAVSGVFLYFTLRSVDLRKMMASMRTIDPTLLLIATACFAAHFVARAFRWRIVVNPIAPVGVRSLLRATVVGFAANNVLPLRFGEFVRALMLTLTEPVPLASAITTVVLVRLLDMVALGTMFVTVLVVFPLPAVVRQGALFAIPIYLAALAFLLALKFREEQALRLLQALLRPFPARLAGVVLSLVRAFLPGLESLRSGWELAKAALITHVAWLFLFAYNALILAAFGFHLPWYAGLVVILTVGFMISIPSSPGYLGVYHVGVTTALSLFSDLALTDESKTAAAFVIHGVQFLVTTGWGVGYMLVSPVRLGDIATALKRPARAEPTVTTSPG